MPHTIRQLFSLLVEENPGMVVLSIDQARANARSVELLARRANEKPDLFVAGPGRWAIDRCLGERGRSTDA